MAKNKIESPKSSVLQLLDIVYSSSLESTNHSWERLNNALRDSLKAAIGSGFAFDLGDWQYIGSEYWLGDDIERWYSRCVADGNVSAIASYEAWKKREPFIADDVTPIESELAHMTGDRKSCRLAVGFEFHWKGQKVKVNSFAADGSYLNAASYEGYRKEPIQSDAVKKKIDQLKLAGYEVYFKSWPDDRKPKKRFKITRQDIIDDRAERKRRDKVWSQIVAFNQKDGRIALITRWLGTNQASKVDALPLSKLEEVLAKCKAKWPEKLPARKQKTVRGHRDASRTTRRRVSDIPVTPGPDQP